MLFTSVNFWLDFRVKKFSCRVEYRVRHSSRFDSALTRLVPSLLWMIFLFVDLFSLFLLFEFVPSLLSYFIFLNSQMDNLNKFKSIWDYLLFVNIINYWMFAMNPMIFLKKIHSIKNDIFFEIQSENQLNLYSIYYINF